MLDTDIKFDEIAMEFGDSITFGGDTTSVENDIPKNNCNQELNDSI